MNIKMITVSALTILALNSNFAFAADDLPKDSMQMSKILANIQKEGFNVITKIEYDEGKYKAEVINNTGKEYKIEIVAQTGTIMNPKKDELHKISIFDAVSKVEAAGYSGIYEIEANKNSYTIKAHDKDNDKKTVEVNATTGEIDD